VNTFYVGLHISRISSEVPNFPVTENLKFSQIPIVFSQLHQITNSYKIISKLVSVEVSASLLYHSIVTVFAVFIVFKAN